MNYRELLDQLNSLHYDASHSWDHEGLTDRELLVKVLDHLEWIVEALDKQLESSQEV
jgi:hypothetical protein